MNYHENPHFQSEGVFSSYYNDKYYQPPLIHHRPRNAPFPKELTVELPCFMVKLVLKSVYIGK